MTANEKQVPPPGSQPSESTSRSIWSDVSFYALTLTQFLGAFNDNLFKQVLLLLFIAVPTTSGTTDFQWLATSCFSIPFVLFSGFAGFLADRFSKRHVIILSKVAEIVVMSAACLLFMRYARTGLTPVMVVMLTANIFLMGTQSAFFGPGKYGSLPELFDEHQLPQANGVIIMTTFMAIILGTAVAGVMKESVQRELLTVGYAAVGIAVAGTVASLFIRRLPPANRELKFHRGSLFVPKEIWDLFRKQRELLSAILVTTVFWLTAALVLQTLNGFGKSDLKLGDRNTSLLVSLISVGIAIGSVIGGLASKGRFNTRLLKTGLWGMVAGLFLMACCGRLLGFYGSAVLLVILGAFCGMFAVPMQAFIQDRPPDELKGRTVATQNLFNWIGIVLSSGVYMMVQPALAANGLPYAVMFAVGGAFMAAVGLVYHPRDVEL